MIFLDYSSLIIIAIGLSADAFATAISVSIINKRQKFTQKLKIAFLFGFFQAFMPLISCLLGSAGASVIERFDHWVAFVLLTYVGSNMLFEVIKDKKDTNIKPKESFKRQVAFKELILLSFATSIDALASGFLLTTVINANTAKLILLSVSIIGGITFVFSLIACYLAEKFGLFLKYKAQIFGGCILILIGIKILLQHLFFL